MKRFGLILSILLIPVIVWGVGSTKRIIELPGFNANRALIVNGSNELDESTVTSTELGYLSGATDTVLTEASTIPLTQIEALTANLAVITDGSGRLATGAVSSTELGFLDGVLSSLCGITDSCTLTNKTLTSPIANLITLDGLTATPSTPSAGDVRFYSKSSDEKLYFLNSSGIEQEVGTGAGSSNNYFADFNADQISNLTQFDDTSSGGDLDGGTATNLTVSSNTSTPINKLRSYRISKAAANASWEGQRITFSGTQVDELAKSGKPFIFSFNYETSANYNAGTEAVSIYYYRVGVDSAAQVCNGRTLSGSVSNTLGVATTAQQFACSFNLTSATTAVRIAWVVTGTGTSTWDLDIDNVYFGPDFQVPGVIVTDWQSFTMSITGSVSDPTKATTRDEGAFWRRVGDEMEVSYFYRHTSNVGAAAGSGIYRFNFPTAAGCAVDTSKIVSSNGGLFVVGTAAGYFGGSDNTSGVAVLNGSGTYFQLSFGDNATGDQTAGSSYKPITSSTAYYTFKASVPCLAYANQSASLSTTQVDLSTVKARAYRSTTQSSGGSARITVTYNTELQDTHNAFNTSTGAFTSPVTGCFDVTAGVYATGVTTTDTQQLEIHVNGTAVKADFQISVSSDKAMQLSGDVCVNRGDVLDVEHVASSDTTYDLVASQPFTFIDIAQKPDFSTFGVYGNYEVLTATSSVKTTPTTNTYLQMTGNVINVTAGCWLLSGEIRYATSGADPDYGNVGGNWAAANGADTSSQPALLTLSTGVASLWGYASYTGGETIISIVNSDSIYCTTEPDAVYLVPYVTLTTNTNAQVTTTFSARRLK